MPYRCIVPGCDNYRKRWEGVSVSYHRLPTDADRCREWLRAIKNTRYDENAPPSAVANLRVCSLHFVADDYSRHMRAEMMGGTAKRLLKTSAVPTICGGNAGHGEAEPRETRGHTETGDQAACTSTAAGRMSSCGTETGRVAALVLSEELQDTLAGTDRSPGRVVGTDTEVTPPETNSAVTEKAALQHVVDEEAILQLMHNCPMCNRKCRCIKRICGPYLIVYQSCYFCHYQRKWASQPEAANISSCKTPTPAKRKPQPKDKVSVNTEVQTSLLDQTLET